MRKIESRWKSKKQAPKAAKWFQSAGAFANKRRASILNLLALTFSAQIYSQSTRTT
jgi:hypothetical protein